MKSNEMNIATYIRERSQELKKLSDDARLDLLAHIFGVAALEAAKHEELMRPPLVPRINELQTQDSVRKDGSSPRQTTLQEVLESLVDVAIKRSEGEARAAFYLSNDVGTGLHRIAGMNKAYGAETDGFRISTSSIACGLAAAIRRPVITDDVKNDPGWSNWLWLAERFEYRGCWSFPIEGRGGKVFGTFSMYFKNPSPVNDRDVQFAEIMTDTAAGIIERQGLS
jgi:GAF domain-containing protein